MKISFGAESLSNQQLPINVETQSGDLIPISVFIVPMIAASLQNTLRTCITSYPYLKHLKLAHPVTGAENFQISLIGADSFKTKLSVVMVQQLNSPNWGTYDLDPYHHPIHNPLQQTCYTLPLFLMK